MTRPELIGWIVIIATVTGCALFLAAKVIAERFDR